MRSTMVIAVVVLLGSMIVCGVGAAQPARHASSLDRLREEMDTLNARLSATGEKEEVLSEKVEGVVHEIERLEAELEAEHSILKEYRLSKYLRQSERLIGELKSIEREKVAITGSLNEVRRQLMDGLREKRGELLEITGKKEGEDLIKNLHEIASITLEIESLQGRLEERPRRKRVEVEVQLTDSPVEVREKAEIIAKEAERIEGVAGTVERRIVELREEQSVREKLVELKEEVTWLEEEAAPSRGEVETGHVYSSEPDYRGSEEGEAIIRGLLPIESWEAFFGATGTARIAEIKKERKELEEERTDLLGRADSLRTVAGELLKLAEEMDKLREK